MHSEIHPVWQNPIQRTIRTAHLSVLMIVHNCRIQCTAQNSSDNLPSYLQTNTIAQMLSIRGEGTTGTNIPRRSVWVELVQRISKEIRRGRHGVISAMDQYHSSQLVVDTGVTVSAFDHRAGRVDQRPRASHCKYRYSTDIIWRHCRLFVLFRSQFGHFNYSQPRFCCYNR